MQCVVGPKTKENNQPYPSESKETTINRILLNPCLLNLNAWKITRVSKSRALGAVQLKLRQPLSKHSTLTDLPQDFKRLVLESQNMLWTRRMHMKSDEIWWNLMKLIFCRAFSMQRSVRRFPCRKVKVSAVSHLRWKKMGEGCTKCKQNGRGLNKIPQSFAKEAKLNSEAETEPRQLKRERRNRDN